MTYVRRSTIRGRRAAAWEATRAATWEFTAAEAAALQEQVFGRVVTPSDDSYPVDRQVYVPNFQYFPQMIVFCEVARDAQRAFEFARHHRLRVVARSSGHSTAGFSVNNGMVIDVSGLDDVYVHPDRRHVSVGAGTSFGKLNAVLAGYGVHVPGGGCSEVCVSGYMQGGGYGLTSLMFGLNCDRVASMRILLTDGTIADVSPASEPELFWALRGGRGNNFGILLQVTYELLELGPVRGFDVNFEMDQAAGALELLERRFAGEAVPSNLGYEAFFTFLPEADGSGPERPLLSVRGVVDGSQDDLDAVLDPLRDAGGSVRYDEQGDYEFLNDFLLGTIPLIDDGSRTITDSRFVGSPAGADGWSTVCDLFRRSPNTGNFIGLEPYGGAINRIGRDETAFVHRDSLFDVFTWVFWFDDEEEAASREWLAEFVDVVGALGNGEAYQNYPNRDNERYAEMYWAEAYPRLQRLRERYDPHNVLGYPQSVRLPAGDEGGAS